MPGNKIPHPKGYPGKDLLSLFSGSPFKNPKLTRKANRLHQLTSPVKTTNIHRSHNPSLPDPTHHTSPIPLLFLKRRCSWMKKVVSYQKYVLLTMFWLRWDWCVKAVFFLFVFPEKRLGYLLFTGKFTIDFVKRWRRTGWLFSGYFLPGAFGYRFAKGWPGFGRKAHRAIRSVACGFMQ